MSAPAAINAQFAGLLPGLLGIELTEATIERVSAKLTVRAELCTLGGILHGGAVMALADTLGAVGAFLNLPPNARTTTLESKTNFLGAAPVGSTVLAECTAVHRGKTTSVWQTSVRSESGKLLGLVVQTQLVIGG
ncbi:MAG: phenylacetic acid degradation protein [Nevskia sp.]|nr:phenylacetic acid degradation protein [Nevskia sp.]